MKNILLIASAAALLLGLPLLGAWVADMPLNNLFSFPPETGYVEHAPFSWQAFVLYAAFVLAWITPFAVRMVRSFQTKLLRPPRPNPFPAWGWAGLGLVAISWTLAWTRFEWFAILQKYTFMPLWAGYILLVNALVFARARKCLLTRRPAIFLALFPLSAIFWWFFEYLNRFVQNWTYSVVDFGPVEYVLVGSISFSTVLPAVLSTAELLQSFPVFNRAFSSFNPVSIPRPRLTASVVLLMSALGLALVGVYPDHLFPLLWISPLLIVVSLRALMSRPHIFSGISRGDWRLVVSSAAAALVCGVFWETWNYFSLAKWTYHVPFVDAFRIFEMPLLGYAGYLPFGLECALAYALLKPENITKGSVDE